MINTNFGMVTHYGYSLSDLENMLPWEREIYAALLMKHIAEENQRMENASKGKG